MLPSKATRNTFEYAYVSRRLIQAIETSAVNLSLELRWAAPFFSKLHYDVNEPSMVHNSRAPVHIHEVFSCFSMILNSALPYKGLNFHKIFQAYSPLCQESPTPGP